MVKNIELSDLGSICSESRSTSGVIYVDKHLKGDSSPLICVNEESHPMPPKQRYRKKSEVEVKYPKITRR